MAENSMYGPSFSSEVSELLRKIGDNKGFLTNEDVKILKFLGKKGDHEDKKVGLVDKYPDLMVELWDIYSKLPRSYYPSASQTMQYFWKWVDEEYELIKK